MSTIDVERLRQIKTLPSLIKFLREELDWPVEASSVDELTFDYAPGELGLDAKYENAVKEIKQIRRLDSKQPWGIFWVNFDKKRLPMVVLRRLLGNLIIKKRASLRKADRPSWDLHDLLFISSYGEEEHRTITFAHFTEDPKTDELPVLRVLGWDDQNSIMQLDRVTNRLHSHFRWPDHPQDVDAWRKRWSEAFTDRYREAIHSADELIPRLAVLAGNIRRSVSDVLEAETERGPMRRLFAAVQRLLIHDMDEDGFADMYAQTVAYGLLSASFSRSADITPQNLVQLTAISNPFLENLLDSLFRLNRGKFHFDVDEVGINDVLDLLRHANIEAIKAAFNDLNPAEDPVIRFYEGFLKAYDPHQRVKRGVFFTPRPVVSLIVRSVHELLQREFGLEDGLASIATWTDLLRKFPDLQPPSDVKPDDPFVLILDPAAGTGTFLNECIEVIERTMKTKWARSLGKRDPESPHTWRDPEILTRWGGYVSEHLLPRLYGFEIMMAPYAIAHLKLTLKLGETGYQFRGSDRLQIYVTNTLEPAEDKQMKLAGFDAIAQEAAAANHIKRTKYFTLIIGNPPYAYESVNTGQWISGLIRDYYQVDGMPLGERNPKGLQDDYVKFIRFAQHLLTESGVGVMSFITNHGYLDNPTFRGMRSSLLGDFDQLLLVDLHGSLLKKETTPEGGKDENVFDIEPGVSISVFVKAPYLSRSISRADLWGEREVKYQLCMSNTLSTLPLTEVEPSQPFYLLKNVNESLRHEYEANWSVADVFETNSVGIVTSRDDFVLAFDKPTLVERISRFVESRQSEADIRASFLKTSDQLPIREIQLRLRRKDWTKCIVPCHYRPFDIRYLLYDKAILGRARERVMNHMLGGDNIAILFRRQYKHGPYSYVLVAKHVAEARFMENAYSHVYVNPLYLYPERTGPVLSSGSGSKKQENLSARFREYIDRVYGTRHSPEEILRYIYAVFHSETYRERYADFLKTDFPRLPLALSLDLFHALSNFGGELVRR